MWLKIVINAGKQPVVMIIRKAEILKYTDVILNLLISIINVNICAGEDHVLLMNFLQTRK